LTNKKTGTQKVRWNKLLFEFLYTKNQGGEAWSKVTPSGDEDYYNNYLYTEGWSYKQTGIGNPLITSRNDMRAGLPKYPKDYFTNNRVVAFHLGLAGGVGQWNILSKFSYSLNYGTFGTSPVGHTTGEKHTPAIYGIFPKTSQFSGYVEANRPLQKGLNLGAIIAADQGRLLNNSAGLFIKVSKTF
jgi:hypothetical protein